MNQRDNDPDCLFCKIVAGELPSERLYEDDTILAFRDIHPKAPLHALVIPKVHIATLNELEEAQAELAGRFFIVARKIAHEHGYAGYRCVVNTNKEGGQVVFHVHLHVLAGRAMAAGMG